jgi:hypothetical protein
VWSLALFLVPVEVFLYHQAGDHVGEKAIDGLSIRQPWATLIILGA